MLDPFVGAIAGQALGGIFGGLFGGGSKPPAPTVTPADEAMIRQTKLMEDMQKRMLEEYEANKMRYFATLPQLQSTIGGALRGMGFTETGGDLGYRSLPFFGLMLRQAEQQANAIRSRLVAQGLDPATADTVAKNIMYRTEQEAIAQGEMQNQQRLLQAVQLVSALLGATQFSPEAIGALMSSAGQMASSMGQMSIAERQMRLQQQLAEQQQASQMWGGLGQLAGMYLSKQWGSSNTRK